MKKWILLIFISGACIAPLGASAAQIYLNPATGKYPPGVTFAVDVRLDNQGQCINAAQVDLSYPKDVVQAVAASNGDSILSLWIKSPTIYADYGVISFTGGLPGGYCGRVSGDPSLSNKLATVYFRFPTSTLAGTSTISAQSANLSFLASTRAFVNDDQGTPAKLTLAGASFSELLNGKYAPVSVWDDALQNDTIPPEPFSIGIYQNTSLFGGRWFAVFSTVDKQTGIDHYDVAEVPVGNLNASQSQWAWAKAVSPYLIKDQKFGSMIAVRAVDAAGNVRVEHYLPSSQAPQQSKWSLGMIPFLAIISVAGLALIRLILSLL